MVPSNTTQSARFTRRFARTRRAVPRRARTRRARTGRPAASCGVRAGPAARRQPAVRAAAIESPAERDQVGEQPVRPGHALGELAEPREARVHDVALAVPRDKEPAAERRLAGIARGEDRREALVPLIREVEPALLHPALEVGGRD